MLLLLLLLSRVTLHMGEGVSRFLEKFVVRPCIIMAGSSKTQKNYCFHTYFIGFENHNYACPNYGVLFFISDAQICVPSRQFSSEHEQKDTKSTTTVLWRRTPTPIFGRA